MTPAAVESGGCSLLPLQLRLELAGMAARHPVGLSGGLGEVETLGGSLASGQFPVGRLLAPQERWLLGVIIQYGGGESSSPSGSCKIFFSFLSH